MADAPWVQALVTIVFGAIAGGLTNAVAIWMLFHPYERRGIGWFGVQGAIPKNRSRLAKTIGRTVGERLLTPEDLARQFSSPALRQTFDKTVHRFVADLLTTVRGPLREEVPQPLVAELERMAADLGPRLAERLAEFSATETFQEPVERFLRRTADSVAEQPLGDVLTEARRTALRERVESWVTQGSQSADLEKAVRGWLDRQIVRGASDQTPLLERLPPGLVAAVERAIAGYLPMALERLAGVLRNPDARGRIEHALHELFRRFVEGLMLHERIVARLVVTERTITRVLDSLGEDGTAQLAAMLDEPAMREHVARSVNDAVVSFLRKPLAEHISDLGQERTEGLAETATGYVLMVLRDEGTQQYAVDRLDRALESAEQRTWGDLLARLAPEQAAAWIGEALQTDQVKQWIAEGWTAGLAAVLDRPIGRPTDTLGEESVDRITERLSPALWEWTQHHVPSMVARLDIQTMVEQKVLGFSLHRIEEIVRRTTQRELDVIVRLGFLLGAIVGAAAFGVSILLT